MNNETRYFQYLAGEKQSDIVIFKEVITDDDMILVCFTDGSRCNQEFILPLNDKNRQNFHLMSEIESPNNSWKFTTEWVGRQEEKRSDPESSEDGSTTYIIQPYVEGREKIVVTPPRKTDSSIAKFGAIQNKIKSTEEAEVKTEVESSLDLNDPVYLMVKKSKKFDTEIELSLIISLPKKNLYDMVEESFDDGGKKMINCMINNINTEIFKKTLKHSLLNFYSKPTKIKESDKNVAKNPMWKNKNHE